MNKMRPLSAPLRATLVEKAGSWTEELDVAVLKLHNASSPEEMLHAERAIHDAISRRADDVVGEILQRRVRDEALLEAATSEARRRAKSAGLHMHSRGEKATTVRLLGGTDFKLRTRLMLPATAKDPAARKGVGKRGKGGSGVYPVLLKLGITDQATPALKALVAREVVAASSVKCARGSLHQHDLRVEHTTALRLTYALGRQAIAARDAAIDAPGTGSELTGKFVIISLDGGRVRVRGSTDPETGKYQAPWREPKVLTIYVVREDGKRDPDFRMLIDGTMGDADAVVALLIGHLRLLGAQHAHHVRLLADGGSWIWNRAEAIREAIGIPATRWSERLDYYHAVQYLGKIVEPISSWSDAERKAWMEDAKARLYEGLAEEVIACIRLLPDPPVGSGKSAKNLVEKDTAILFFGRHRDRIGYLGTQLDKTTMGSGAVESAIRRTVNLRMKGNSIFWLEDHAEPMLHLRACLVTERWDDMVLRAITEPMWPAPMAAA